MLDVAIIGGGVSGLALADKLTQRGRAFALFEARDRIGGRVLTLKRPGGAGLDLGPTWFWPETQPLAAQLIRELQLTHFAQRDEGPVLHLKEGDKRAEVIEDKSLYDGARRLHGGMGALIDALAARLPEGVIHLKRRLSALRDEGDHVVMTFETESGVEEVAAKSVVLTLPPRLIRELVRFAPALDEPTDVALAGAETWMAAQAKTIFEYPKAFWRDEGLSGSAFVTHEQAVLGEIFDACDVDSGLYALGGFFALGPELRDSFSVGMPILLESQINNVFGRVVQHAGMHIQDWAHEPYTCSEADRTGALQDGEHPDVANPMLRRALWDRKLYFGGSETAARNAGYIEGALDAVRRVDRALASIETKKLLAGASGADPFAGLPVNEASLARFAAWVDGHNDLVMEDYKRRLNRALAAQQRDDLTQIAMLGAIEDGFAAALKQLEALPFDMSGVAVERGRTELTPLVQKPFADFLQSIMDDVVAFNRTSCALSNFPGEHHLSKEYTRVIMQDIAAAWREFSLAANRALLDKKEAQRAEEKAV